MPIHPAPDDPIADQAAAGDSTPEGGTAPETPAPMNRAERRAQRKGGGTPPAVAKVTPRNVNTAPGHRQWANRRSG